MSYLQLLCFLVYFTVINDPLQIQLKREFPSIEVPAIPRVPAKAKHFEATEWYNFFKIILDDPNYSESGALRTFVSFFYSNSPFSLLFSLFFIKFIYFFVLFEYWKISTQNKTEDLVLNTFGEIIKEGPLTYHRKSNKSRRIHEIECYCVIRLRILFMYRTKYGIPSQTNCNISFSLILNWYFPYWNDNSGWMLSGACKWSLSQGISRCGPQNI